MQKNFIHTLERDIRAKHLTQHPFYKAWDRGEVPMKALKEYARQYFLFVSEFPRLVSRVHANTRDLDDRIAILDNLNEEEDPKLPHEELWLRFAEGLGIKRSEMNPKPLPETKKMLATLRRLCDKGIAEGSAALLAYEAQIPEIARIKKEGLVKFYNCTTKRALKFFNVHQVADIEHQKTWKRLIKKHATTPTAQKETRAALDTSLDAMWNMLTGVEKAWC